jgi:sulfur carrier protein
MEDIIQWAFFLVKILNKRGDKMIINGTEMDFERVTITQLLEKLDLEEEKVVVEVNFQIIPKEKYEEYVLNKADKVEIVSFVGGG